MHLLGIMHQERLSKFFDSIFEKYYNRKPIFKDRRVLTDSFIPETILHREKQIEDIVSILAPALRAQKPSNIFLYGKTGTGKTLTAKYISKHLANAAIKHNIPLQIIYINCKMKKVSDTEYRAIYNILKELGCNVSLGLPLDDLYKKLFDTLDKKEKLFIFILDEIDYLIKKAGDTILYNFVRINSELNSSQVSIIGISNSLTFIDNLDPRIKSSLSSEEILFPPYNAYELIDILKQRAKLAFYDGVIEEGVIEKIAAIAAREHGDARRALDLLRLAGEIAEREGSDKVKISHVDAAIKKLEIDKIVEIGKTLPRQAQIILYAIIKLHKEGVKKIYTGDFYNYYCDLCNKIGYPPLSQRRVSEIISELDMLDIINARIVNRGKYGRTREISLAISEKTLNKLFEIFKRIFENE